MHHSSSIPYPTREWGGGEGLVSVSGQCFELREDTICWEPFPRNLSFIVEWMKGEEISVNHFLSFSFSFPLSDHSHYG